ncbi:MAG: glucose-6-phosphate dehydrogenase, partial [Anaerolineales bacterium]|nr:glucose-6-phosphate dehydrogenase [Anaerolineales bacterium]
SVDMEFHYENAFGSDAIPDAYERLLLDALNGDPSLFTRADTIELAWGLVDGVIDAWEQDSAPQLARYESGSWGPEQAEEFLRRDGRHWSMGCHGH